MLHEVFNPACAAVNVTACDKTEAISVLVDLLVKSGKVPDREALIKAVMEREALAPTGLGEDCAIPHAQTDVVSTTSIAAVRLATPVDFNAPDGTTARLVFLIVGPKDSAAVHLRLLSRLARILSDIDFRTTAMAAPDAAAFASMLLKTDEPAAPRA
jgi:fructose-specific phosphotransferase system IIA component